LVEGQTAHDGAPWRETNGSEESKVATMATRRWSNAGVPHAFNLASPRRAGTPPHLIHGIRVAPRRIMGALPVLAAWVRLPTRTTRQDQWRGGWLDQLGAQQHHVLTRARHRGVKQFLHFSELLLTQVYDWFTEGFDTKELMEAKVLLA